MTRTIRHYFEYKGHMIHRNTEIGYKMRYWCYSNNGTLCANTQREIKELITATINQE